MMGNGAPIERAGSPVGLVQLKEFCVAVEKDTFGSILTSGDIYQEDRR